MNEDRSRSDRPVRTLTETDETRDHWYDRVLVRLGLKPRESIRHDLEDALEEAVEDTDFSPQERAMLKNVLSFHRIRVEDVMVPRADIVAVASETNLGELLSLFRTAGHSRLPVYGETLDDPKGMVHIRDFLDFIAMRADSGATEAGAGDETRPPSLGQIDLSMTLAEANILRPVLFVPRSMPAIDLLVRMQATRTHMALVIDEYGGTDGLVSIEDLVEMVVGDIEDEHDEDEGVTIAAAADGTYIADARASLDEVKETLGVDLTEEEGAEDIDTIGGFIATLAGRVPSRSEVIVGPAGLEFEVLDADPRRVKKLRIHRRTPATSEVEISEGRPLAPRSQSAAAE
ncbi:hemolysin family protein [Microvirga arsenatis]|uniref:CBS domain-containing protein n=1 Tax=Microvirga arsenatis TaxID=2692265 RepID=A0ABW9YWI7_9HYPH|nr:hemolysin family protein [Microvirga arsenatis]NBJ13566.1 CBS domain-containing protein [Microvirga arsenatis]NBJ23875.1 CBS domain-containing protein [Microvirga arsenatis]